MTTNRIRSYGIGWNRNAACVCVDGIIVTPRASKTDVFLLYILMTIRCRIRNYKGKQQK